MKDDLTSRTRTTAISGRTPGALVPKRIGAAENKDDDHRDDCCLACHCHCYYYGPAASDSSSDHDFLWKPFVSIPTHRDNEQQQQKQQQQRQRQRQQRDPIDNQYIMDVVEKHIDGVNKQRPWYEFGRSFNDLRFSRRHGGRDMTIRKLCIFEYSHYGGLFVQAHYAIEGSDNDDNNDNDNDRCCGEAPQEDGGWGKRINPPSWFEPRRGEYIRGFRVFHFMEGRLLGMVVVTNQREEAGRYGRFDAHLKGSWCDMIAPPDTEVFALCGSTVWRGVALVGLGFLARPRRRIETETGIVKTEMEMEIEIEIEPLIASDGPNGNERRKE